MSDYEMHKKVFCQSFAVAVGLATAFNLYMTSSKLPEMSDSNIAQYTDYCSPSGKEEKGTAPISKKFLTAGKQGAVDDIQLAKCIENRHQAMHSKRITMKRGAGFAVAGFLTAMLFSDVLSSKRAQTPSSGKRQIFSSKKRQTPNPT